MLGFVFPPVWKTWQGTMQLHRWYDFDIGSMLSSLYRVKSGWMYYYPSCLFSAVLLFALFSALLSFYESHQNEWLENQRRWKICHLQRDGWRHSRIKSLPHKHSHSQWKCQGAGPDELKAGVSVQTRDWTAVQFSCSSSHGSLRQSQGLSSSLQCAKAILFPSLHATSENVGVFVSFLKNSPIFLAAFRGMVVRVCLSQERPRGIFCFVVVKTKRAKSERWRALHPGTFQGQHGTITSWRGWKPLSESDYQRTQEKPVRFGVRAVKKPGGKLWSFYKSQPAHFSSWVL